MNDLKLLVKNNKEIEDLLNIVEEFSSDIRQRKFSDTRYVCPTKLKCPEKKLRIFFSL